MNRARAAQLARAAFLVAALVLAVLALRHDGDQALDQARSVGGMRLAGALALAVAGLVCSGFAWRELLSGLGGRLPVRTAFDVFFVGQLGKYLPGSVFAVLGQVQRARGAGAGRATVGGAALLAMVMNIASGALVAVAVLPFADAGVVGQHPEIVVALPLGLVLLHPRVFGPALDRLLRLAHRPPLPRRPSLRSMATALGWSVLMWACYGAHVWLLADGLGAHGGRVPLLATGGYALSWVAGFLFVLAPAGLGVREAALVLALRGVLPASAALAVSILSRLLMTAADLVVAAGAVLLRRTVRSVPSSPEPDTLAGGPVGRHG